MDGLGHVVRHKKLADYFFCFAVFAYRGIGAEKVCQCFQFGFVIVEVMNLFAGRERGVVACCGRWRRIVKGCEG